jgi:hypothetical protein
MDRRPYALAMSRGQGRVQRTILDAVESSRYGTTIQDLVWRCYPGEEATEAQVTAVGRAVRRLIAEGRLMEQPGFYGRRITPAPPSKPQAQRLPPEPGPARASAHVTDDWLQCAACEVRWRRGDDPVCWSCGRPGTPAAAIGP